MKVFVSSTCYDLVDLRAELEEELRDMGGEPHFSDSRTSDFKAADAPDVNSIETCLENLRNCGKVIVILSQRYGPSLPRPFEDISATHLEYREALKKNKPLLFYIRDRLHADFSSWKRNGKREDFKAVWAKAGDEQRLFKFIEEHQTLVRPDGLTDHNNWYSTFSTSVDLRQDIRRHLAVDAYRASGHKLVESGHAPIVVIVGQGVEQHTHIEAGHFARFTFTISNVGTVSAIDVQGTMRFPHGADLQPPSAALGALAPKEKLNISFDALVSNLDNAIEKSPPNQNGNVHWDLLVSYSAPSGHVMIDTSRIQLRKEDRVLRFTAAPLYVGKRIVGLRDFLTGKQIVEAL